MSSFKVYEKLYQLYSLAIEFGLEWMIYTLEVESQIEHLAEALPCAGIDYHKLVSSAARPDDSCGYVAGQLCDLLLPEDHDMKNIKQGYRPISSILKIKNNVDDLDYPQLMRVEIERKPAKNKWITSHSYMVLVHGPDDIHVLQAYVGHYTLDEYLFNDKWSKLREFNDGFSFHEYLKLLRELENDAQVGKIYKDMFGSNFAKDIKQQMRVKCRLKPFDSNYSINQIHQRLNFISETVTTYPTLLANSYSEFLKAELYQRDSDMFSVFKHIAIFNHTKEQLDHFGEYLSWASQDIEESPLNLPIKKSQSLVDYIAKHRLVAGYSPRFWRIAAGTAIAVAVGGAIVYSLTRGDD